MRRNMMAVLTAAAVCLGASADVTNFWQDVVTAKVQSWPADVAPCDGVKSLWLEGEPYQGRPTRIFAYYGLPEGLTPGEKCPGIVLVHGGSGTAYGWWVKMWTKRGYAAIAMDNCGAIPLKDPATKKWQRHAWSGPEGWGGFGAADKEPKEQWTYHAVAAVIRSQTFLRTQEQVDANRIGLTGISWGGYLTCIAAGVDPRFRFAVPVYGCGYYGESPEWRKSLDKLADKGAKWLSLWDPSVYLPQATCPFLWVSGKHDRFYPYAALVKSSKLTKGPVEYAIKEEMVHGHNAGSVPEVIHAFAEKCLMPAK